MMMQIKIECGCGQHYAFEVEAAGDLEPNTIACPACGADGTPAANAAIGQTLSAQAAPVAAPAASSRIRVAVPTPAARTATLAAPAPAATLRRPRPGQMEPAQAQHEARAKILWGDTPEAVIGFLLLQGFEREEATELVQEMFRERLATVRATGFRKIFAGTGLVIVPVVTSIIMLSFGVINLWIWATTIIMGLSGAWMALNGVFMVLNPKSQAGDACDND